MRAPPIVTKGRETGNTDGIPVHFKRRCGFRLIEAIKPESQSIKRKAGHGDYQSVTSVIDNG